MTYSRPVGDLDALHGLGRPLVTAADPLRGEVEVQLLQHETGVDQVSLLGFREEDQKVRGIDLEHAFHLLVVKGPRSRPDAREHDLNLLQEDRTPDIVRSANGSARNFLIDLRLKMRS
jgi:hypothetical protein